MRLPILCCTLLLAAVGCGDPAQNPPAAPPGADTSPAATAAAVAHPVRVDNPRIRAMPPGAPSTAGYLSLRNTGSEERLIVGASTPLSERVEIHMHVMRDGMMGMRPIPHEHLPPGATVTFQPGGTHLMLFAPKRPLTPGETVPVTLLFDDGSSLEQAFTVVRPGADG